MIERSHQRFPASLPGALMAHDGPHVIRSVDLSRNGCRIENTVQLISGTSVGLFLVPPGEDIALVIRDAEVRWSCAEGIGIEFQAVADHERDRLDLLINQIKKQHPGTS